MGKRRQIYDDSFSIDGKEDPIESMTKENEIYEPKFVYLGRMTNKKHFRAFVYGKNKAVQLADNYQEFMKFINTGLWFESAELASILDTPVKRKYVRKETKIEEGIEEPQEEDLGVIEYGTDR